MKLQSIATTEPELGKFINILRRVLSNLSLDNFSAQELRGVTSGISDEGRKFKHSLEAAPRMWFALEGDVYIPKGGLGTSEIEIRSRLTDHPFTIILIQ